MTIAGVSEVLRGHDLVVVIGAQVFRYYPYVAGEYLPEGTELLQITADPRLAGAAPVGDSLLGDSRWRWSSSWTWSTTTATRHVPPRSRSAAPPARPAGAGTAHPGCGVVDPEHRQARRFAVGHRIDLDDGPTTASGCPPIGPASFFATASGGSAGACPPRSASRWGTAPVASSAPVVATIGDGSFQYSVQAIWTAAQHRLPIVFVVMRNDEYSILKSFAVLEKTPGVPGLDLPGLDIASLARGFGCRAANVATAEELEQEFKTALTADTPTVIVVSTQPQKAML